MLCKVASIHSFCFAALCWVAFGGSTHRKESSFIPGFYSIQTTIITQNIDERCWVCPISVLVGTFDLLLPSFANCRMFLIQVLFYPKHCILDLDKQFWCWPICIKYTSEYIIGVIWNGVALSTQSRTRNISGNSVADFGGSKIQN